MRQLSSKKLKLGRGVVARGEAIAAIVVRDLPLAKSASRRGTFYISAACALFAILF